MSAKSSHDITYNNSLTKLTFVVDQEKYENSFDGFAILGPVFSAMFYQLIDGVDPDKYKVEVELKNKDTGKVFNTLIYPDLFDEEQQ